MKASEEQVAGNHYKEFAIQPTEFIQKNNIGFIEGNVIKYVCRHKKKNGRQDIEKAIHYLQLLLEYEYIQAKDVFDEFQKLPEEEKIRCYNEHTNKPFNSSDVEKWMSENGYSF